MVNRQTRSKVLKHVEGVDGNKGEGKTTEHPNMEKIRR